MPTPTLPRVLHVVSHLDLGGAEEVAISLASGLAGEQSSEFFAVRGVARSAVGQAMHARLAELEVPVYAGTSLDMKRGALPHAAVRLADVLRCRQPDLVHLHTEIPEATYALASCLRGFRAPPPVVRTIHNTTLWPAWGRVGAWVERRLAGASVVAVSHDSLRGLQDFRSSWSIPALPGKSEHVVYNGVSRLPSLSEGRHEAPGGAAQVLFAGRLELQKGADLLPELVARAATLSGRPAQVTVLGDGSLAAGLRRWAQQPGLPWPVTVSPARPGLRAYLGDFDVVLMPSRFEGFGLLAAEALLAGTPVVATDIPGLREVLAPPYPLLAPPGDLEAIARLLADVVDNPSRYRELACRLRGGVQQRFGVEQMLDGYRRVYRNLPHPVGEGVGHECPRGA